MLGPSLNSQNPIDIWRVLARNLGQLRSSLTNFFSRENAMIQEKDNSGSIFSIMKLARDTMDYSRCVSSTIAVDWTSSVDQIHSAYCAQREPAPLVHQGTARGGSCDHGHPDEREGGDEDERTLQGLLISVWGTDGDGV